MCSGQNLHNIFVATLSGDRRFFLAENVHRPMKSFTILEPQDREIQSTKPVKSSTLSQL